MIVCSGVGVSEVFAPESVTGGWDALRSTSLHVHSPKPRIIGAHRISVAIDVYHFIPPRRATNGQGRG